MLNSALSLFSILSLAEAPLGVRTLQLHYSSFIDILANMIQFAPPNMKPLHSTHFAHRQAFQNHSVSQSNLLLWCCSTILWGSGILMCFSISVSTFRRHGSWTRGRFSISTFRRYGSWTRGPCIDTYLWLGAHVTQVTFMSYVVFVSVLTVMAAVYPTPPHPTPNHQHHWLYSSAEGAHIRFPWVTP